MRCAIAFGFGPASTLRQNTYFWRSSLKREARAKIIYGGHQQPLELKW